MPTVTVHQAKTNLSRLIADALAGEEVIIARGSTPAVKLVPVEPKPNAKREFGKYKGMFTIHESFYEPMSEEELALWEDGEIS